MGAGGVEMAALSSVTSPKSAVLGRPGGCVVTCDKTHTPLLHPSFTLRPLPFNHAHRALCIFCFVRRAVGPSFLFTPLPLPPLCHNLLPPNGT